MVVCKGPTLAAQARTLSPLADCACGAAAQRQGACFTGRKLTGPDPYPRPSQVYAWKLLALEDALRRAPAVLWLDAGSTVVAPLGEVGDALLADGYFLVQVRVAAARVVEVRRRCSGAASGLCECVPHPLSQRPALPCTPPSVCFATGTCDVAARQCMRSKQGAGAGSLALATVRPAKDATDPVHAALQGQDMDMTPWVHPGTLAALGVRKDALAGRPSFAGNTQVLRAAPRPGTALRPRMRRPMLLLCSMPAQLALASS